MNTPSKPVNRAGEPSHILLVDDSRGMRIYLRTILGAAGFTCTDASDGAEAFDLVLANTFDAIITDLDMPRMGGLELLAALSLLPKGVRRPPVIVVSARMSEEQRRRRPELKLAARILDKPAAAGELLDALAAVLPIGQRSL